MAKPPPPPKEGGAAIPNLATLLPSARILWRVDCQSKKRAFEKASILLENVGKLPRDELFSRLIARERLGSTSIGKGGAVPHIRMPELQKPLCALLRLAAPVQYQTARAAGKEPAGETGEGAAAGEVDTLFFLVVPEKAHTAHLQLLAVFSKMLLDDDFMGRLGECADANAAARCIADWEEEQSDALAEIFAGEGEDGGGGGGESDGGGEN